MCTKTAITKFGKWFGALMLCCILVLVFVACVTRKDAASKQILADSVKLASCVELQVLPNNHTYQQNEAIVVTATLSVLTDLHLLSSLWCDMLSTWEVRIVDEQGQPVPNIIGGAGAGCRLSLDITYEYPFEDSLSLDDYFDLSAAGTYTLTIAKHVSTWTAETIKATSEPVTFTRLP